MTWRQFAFTGYDAVIAGFAILFCESIKATGEMKSGCLCLAVSVLQNSMTVLVRRCDFILAQKALQNSGHVFIPPFGTNYFTIESSGKSKKIGLRGIGAKPVKKTPTEPQFKIEVRGRTRAERVISFVESLPVTSGILAGKRFRLGAWQKKIIREIYRTGRNGRRTVRQALLSFPRKNGKTTFTAALALAHLAGPEREQRGERPTAGGNHFPRDESHGVGDGPERPRYHPRLRKVS